jgi:hypothetical protein
MTTLSPWSMPAAANPLEGWNHGRPTLHAQHAAKAYAGSELLLSPQRPLRQYQDYPLFGFYLHL